MLRWLASAGKAGRCSEVLGGGCSAVVAKVRDGEKRQAVRPIAPAPPRNSNRCDRNKTKSHHFGQKHFLAPFAEAFFFESDFRSPKEQKNLKLNSRQQGISSSEIKGPNHYTNLVGRVTKPLGPITIEQ